MNSQGEIIHVENEAEAKRRNLIPIPENERAEVEAMGEEERRAWYQRKLAEREKANRPRRRKDRRRAKAARKARRRLRSSMKRK